MTQHFDHVAQSNAGDPKRQITASSVITTQDLLQGARGANTRTHREQVSPWPAKALSTDIKPETTMQSCLRVNR